MTPETKGLMPPARAMHSMVYLNELSIIAIYGGRNDNLRGTSPTSGCFNDLHILHLEKLAWLQVIIGGMERMPRYSHSAAAFGSKMVVFGGMNFQTYLPSEVEIIELDQSSASKLQTYSTEKARKQLIFPALAKGVNALSDISQVQPSQSQALQTNSKKNVVTFLPVPRREELKTDPNDSTTGKNKDKPSLRKNIRKVMAVNRFRGFSAPNIESQHEDSSLLRRPFR